MHPLKPTPDELKQRLLEHYKLTPETQEAFLFPQYELADPFLFADMDRAISRIHEAIQSGEHIGIYADYDCDGIPASVVLLDLFKKIGVADRVHVYIPDRHDEGYGVSMVGIDALAALGVTLMLTVDVGITALAEVADAQSRSIDVIVTDHHAMLEILPSAYAVVHPMHGLYSNKDACGAAVAFYVVRAFVMRYASEYGIPDGWEKWLLDLVGFATLSDMVPLVGENRTLATYGLMVMRKTKRLGLRTLFAANTLSMESLVEQDLTFTVAPRLNAASRMATPMLAFELLATDDFRRASEIVKTLDEINGERKLLVARIVKDAHARLESRELPDIVVIGDLTWRPAVLGLVANKLQETYGRSFFVWGEAGDGVIKGSCRMLAAHHAAHLMQAVPEGMLLHAGGHQAAGGFAISKDQVHFFEAALNTALTTLSAPQDDSQEIAPVLPMPLSIATVRHYQTVRSFAPFGVGNPEPLFLFKQVTVVSTKKFGKGREHLECLVEDITGSATAFTFFCTKELAARVVPDATISFTGTIEPGWRGGMRIKIKELC